MFTVAIAALDNGQVFAIIKSNQESKQQRFQAPNMKLLMTRVSQAIRKRYQMLQHFPKPAPPSILRPGEAQILWTPNGH